MPQPALEDVRALFEFARRAKVKVIYSLRLENDDPESAARYARFIQREFREQLDSFAIGNEPDYYKDYDVYRAKWAAIRDAILRERLRRAARSFQSWSRSCSMPARR